MKKNLFLIGLAAIGMLFASCSNDETVEVAKGKAIGFKTFVNNSTRAANDVTTDNLDAFKVWGLMNKGDQTGKPFVAQEVKKENNTWSYTPPVYWEKGYAYSFVALAPNDAYTFNAPTAINTWGSLTFENDKGEKDLIYATAKQTTVEGKTCPAAVNLTFNHMLSRVRFQFTNAMDDGSTLTVTDVKITNAYTSGTATLAEQLANLRWTPGTATGELAFDNATTTQFAQNASCVTGHKYMIPANKAYKVTFKVERTHNGVVDTYNHTVPLTAMQMESGKSYQFKAVFTSKNVNPEGALCPIVFEPTVNKWDDTWKDEAIDMNQP